MTARAGDPAADAPLPPLASCPAAFTAGATALRAMALTASGQRAIAGPAHRHLFAVADAGGGVTCFTWEPASALGSDGGMVSLGRSLTRNGETILSLDTLGVTTR